MLGKEKQQRDFFDEHVYGRLVPEDHLLLRIAREIDFSFVEQETRDLYSEGMGRPSFPPVVLFKVLLLEYLYELSDVKVSQECQWNLLFRRFIGLGIEDDSPDDTTLVVFRRRLGEERFKRLFDCVVEQAVEKGLVRGDLKVVDATHIEADVTITNTAKLLQQGRRHIIRDVEKTSKGEEKELRERYWREESFFGKPSKEGVREEIELTKEFIEEVRERFGDKAKEKLELLESLVDEGEGRGAKLRSFADTDARGGYKSAKKPFIGYKAHISYDDGSDIVTSCEVLTGEKNEGKHLKDLLEDDANKGISHEAVVGDGLYDTAENRKLIHKEGMRAFIPSSRKKKHLNEFTYVVEADRVLCPGLKMSVGKSKQGDGYLHIFSGSECRECLYSERCQPARNVDRVRVYVSDDYQLKVMDECEQRKEALGRRKLIERKFGEAKRWHGMRRARYRGKWRVTIQVFLTFIVMNVKRIVKLLEGGERRRKLVEAPG